MCGVWIFVGVVLKKGDDGTEQQPGPWDLYQQEQEGSEYMVDSVNSGDIARIDWRQFC